MNLSIHGWRDAARAWRRRLRSEPAERHDAFGVAEEWPTGARERYLGGATDAAQLERLERAWERECSNAYRLPG